MTPQSATPEMVEIVARALHVEERKAQPVEFYYFLARAAIAAMREPTEAMLRRSVDTHNLSSWTGVNEHWARCAWHAMIDVALSQASQPPPAPVLAPGATQPETGETVVRGPEIDGSGK